MNNSKAVYVYRIFDSFVSVVRNIRPYKKMGYYVYLWLIFNSTALLEIILHKKIHHQKVLGYELNFSSYSCFLDLFEEIFFTQVYDFETDNPNPTILDCGANIGMASFYFKLKYPNSRIVCFEPGQTTSNFLKNNLSKFNGMTFISAGLSDRNGHGFLYHFKDLKDGEFSTDKNLYKELEYTKESVRLMKLSEFTKDLKVVDFLKLDIEGNEEKVLNDLDSAKQLEKIKQIMMEFHQHQGNSLVKILSILEKNNFKVIVSGGVRPPLSKRKNITYFLYVFAYR